MSTAEMTNQTTETPTVEATGTPESVPEVTSEETPTPEVPATPEGQVAAPPPYQVNPAFRVRNQEKKFDDFILPAIKDPETEKKVRELYEKAHGLDYIKEDRERLRGELDGVKREFTPVVQAVHKMAHFVKQKDYASFFNLAGIQPQEIFQWALNFAQMSPEQRMAHERAQTEAQRAYDLEQYTAQQQQQFQQQSAEYRARELDFTLGRPDVSQAAQAFDARYGDGAFKTEVIRRGQFYAYQGQDISAEQAVSEVLRLAGQGGQQAPQTTLPPQGAAIPQQVPQGQPAPQTVPQAQSQKPVIPNIQGRGTSPVKKVPKSLAEMRKLGQELSE